jgi:uncharacterized membrane protein HdeD (DUF308 family)
MTKETSTQRSSGTPWWLILLQGIFAIVLGLLLLVYPGMATLVVIQFVGIYWLISGVFNIVGIFLEHADWGWKLFVGILGIIAGLLVIQHPLWSTVLIPATLIVIIGLVALVFGIVSLIAVFRGGGWSAGILGAIGILIGLALLGSLWVSTMALPTVVGAIALVGGIAAIVQAFRMRK